MFEILNIDQSRSEKKMDSLELFEEKRTVNIYTSNKHAKYHSEINKIRESFEIDNYPNEIIVFEE